MGRFNLHYFLSLLAFSYLGFWFLSYSDKKAYGQSKLANILHANELSRRLKVNWLHIIIQIWICDNSSRI